MKALYQIYLQASKLVDTIFLRRQQEWIIEHLILSLPERWQPKTYITAFIFALFTVEIPFNVLFCFGFNQVLSYASGLTPLGFLEALRFGVLGSFIVPFYKCIWNGGIFLGGWLGEKLYNSMHPRIAKPPAHMLVRVLSYIFPKKAFDQIFSQIIADARIEHCEILAIGDVRRARWMVVLLVGQLLSTAVFWCSTQIVRRITSLRSAT